MRLSKGIVARGVAVLRRSLAASCTVLLWAGAASAGVWTNPGPIGGNVKAVVFDPVTPSTVYAGSHGGGFFKSTDGGQSWSPINDGVASPSSFTTEAAAVDPVSTSRVYFAVSSGSAGGVFRSTNGGASWSFSSLGFATDVAIDPATPSTLYASGDGVYKSMNAGLTWTQILSGTSFYSVAVDPSSPSTVYAGNLFGGISKSVDGGASWTSLSPGAGAEAVESIVVDPTSSAVVYAGLEDRGVYKSVNGGMNWTPLGPTDGTHPFSVQKLVIDPAAHETIYVAGFFSGPTPTVGVHKTVNGGASWQSTTLVGLVRGLALGETSPPTLLAGVQDGNGIWRSTDAGASWDVANDGFVNTSVGAFAPAPAQPGRVWAATSFNGVFRSDDSGASWQPTALTRDLEQFYSIAADPTAAGTAYVGTHFDGVYKTIDGGDTWAQVSSGTLPLLIGALVVDPATPATIYAGGFGGVARSTTGGGNWSFVNDGLFPVVTAIAIDPATPSTLYAGTDPLQGPFTGVFKTTNGGGQWTPVNAGLPALNELAVQTLAIDPAAPATVYVGLENAGVYKTIDGGASWTGASSGLSALDVRSLVVDPVLPDTVYAATPGGVFVTTNGGASWSPSNFGLSNLEVRAVAAADGRVHAGTIGSGAFVSDAATSPPQPIRGKSLVVQNPNTDDASKRKITVMASESGSAATIDVAALVANGALLTVTAQGDLTYSQTYALPAPWTPLGTTGARYVDRNGVHGPVTGVDLIKSPNGTIKLKVTILGKRGFVAVVPPNPGSSGQVRLEVNGGDSYCVGFGGAAGGKVVNKGPLLFKVTNPTAAACS